MHSATPFRTIFNAILRRLGLARQPLLASDSVMVQRQGQSAQRRELAVVPNRSGNRAEPMLSGPNESVEDLLQAQPRRTGQTGTLLMQAQTETRQVKQQGATVARMVSQNQNEQGASRLGREITMLRTKQEDLAETLEQLLPMLCPVGQMCFPAGTIVDTKHGKRPIQMIEKGEAVWARDPITGEWRLGEVDETFRREYNGRIFSVVAGGETIRVTERHPFRVLSGNGLDKRPIIDELGADNLDNGDGGRWVEAQHLQKGDVLVCRERGEIEVEEVSGTEQSITVYNLRVAECRSYTVGESGVLVHNNSMPDDGCCDPAPSTTARPSTLRVSLASGPDADVASSAVSNQPQAHHIVAGAAGAAESREILAEFPVCIGINDAINGVWLPQTSGVTVPASTNPLGRVFHNQTFTPRYYAYVLQQLEPVRGNKMGVETVLRALRTELANGDVNW